MGANPFDVLQKAMYGVVAQTMGYDASWLYPDDSVRETARVLFMEPTAKATMQEQDYEYTRYQMEYFVDVFIGLKESADKPANATTVAIGGNKFAVRKVIKKYDGKTFIAILEPQD